MSLLSEIKTKYDLADISVKLIFANVGVFAVIAIYNALYFSFNSEPASFFSNYFSLPDDLNDLIYRPWSIITYAFLHGSFMHLLGNVIVLFFTGRIFLNLLSAKHFLNYYFLGIIVGGLLFLLSYNFLPAFRNEDAILVGASAAIFSTLVGITTYVPNYEVYLFGSFKLKLWIITVFLLIAFIAGIPGPNSGGEFAHLGGALIGYIYTIQLKKGNDIGVMLTSLFKSKKQQPLKTVYKKSNPKSNKPNEVSQQRKIDAILDKISKSGYETLSKEEKDFLFSVRKK